MEPFCERSIGPYRITGALAEAPNAVVYRGVDPISGAAIAVKTLRCAEHDDIEGFRREVHALQQLHQPNIVRVLGSGVEAGTPWFAMELLEGGTLEDRWRQPQRPAASWSLRVLQQLCEPLAFLHGEGLVHRDLKPRNIGFRRDGSLVLMDLGLVGRFSARIGREQLEAGGAIIGTFQYMAPEQARGEFVDARADLYSLGCILYEALTGRPPFEGSGWELISQHLDAQPEAPSRRAPVPAVLDTLVMRLLAKDARDRPGFAEDVAGELAPFTGCDAKKGVGRAYLYRPGFVGRRTTVVELNNALRRLRDGVGECVLIAGESGAGKTRMAMEVTQQATISGLAVVTGECVPLLVSAETEDVRAAPLHPFLPLLRLIADRCRREGRQATERLLGRRAKVLATYEPTLASIPGYAELPEPVPLSPPAARARVLADLTESINATAAENPLVIVLDDLQWSDDLTLALLSVLQRRLGEMPVLILGTYRIEEAGELLQDLARAPGVSSIELGRLDRDSIHAMAGDMLALRSPPKHLVGFLGRVSEGNPFFIAEYLRAAVGAQLLRRSASGRWEMDLPGEVAESRYEELPLPHSLRDLIARRLEDLSSNSQVLIEVAAVIGRDFHLELVADLAGLSTEQSLDSIHQLRVRQIVEVSDRSALRFAHDKLREVAYGQITPERRRELHGRAAKLLETRHLEESDFPRLFTTLAHHWQSAGEFPRALEYMGRAGEHSLVTGAHADAYRLLKQALDLDNRVGRPVASFTRAQWHRMLGCAAFGVADLEASITHSGTALAALGIRVPSSAAGWAGVLCVELPEQLGRLMQPRLFERNAVATNEETLYEVAVASDQLATSYYYAAEPLPAVASLVRGLNRAERVGAPVGISSARLGFIAGAAGLNRLSRRYFERARRQANDSRQLAHRATALYMEAMDHMGKCRWRDCENYAEESARIFDDIGDSHEAATAQAILANGRFYAGHIGDALRGLRALVESPSARSNVLHESWGSFLSARSLIASGAAEGIVRELENARRLILDLPETLSIAMCEGTLSLALALEGNLPRAVEIAQTLLRRLISNRPWVPQCLDGYGSCAEVLLLDWATRSVEERGRPEIGLARAACRELRGFARRFPLALPAALRCSGWEQSLLGHPRAARRVLLRGIAAARAQSMPFEEARTRFVASRVLLDGAEREGQARAACEKFVALECEKLVARLSGLTVGPSLA